MKICYSAGLFLLLWWSSCTVQDTVVEENPAVVINRAELLSDLEYLSSDELEGRAPGTRGSRLAREYIEKRFVSIGLGSFGESYRYPFPYVSRTGNEETGVNLIGFVSGTVNEEQYIAVTAHYDHLGIGENGEIFNGADDNASGTAGLIAAAKWFRENPPENSLLFLLLDAEEQGLMGSRHFVAHPVVPLEEIVMNVNLDMIGNNRADEIYAVGTWHHDYLEPLVTRSAANAPIQVLFGHDSPGGELADWTTLSDHYPFHQQGIPFIYFGVEDHEHYHQPSDRFETIDPGFYYNTVQLITSFIRHADRNLDEIREMSGR